MVAVSTVKPQPALRMVGTLSDVFFVVGVDHRLLRKGRMEVDRHIERFGALIDRPEPLVVQEHAVGEAVQHGALEAELGDAALQLVGAFARIVGRYHGEAGKACRVQLDRGMQAIIDAARQLERDVVGQLLSARCAVREDLDVDARFVHFLDADLAQIVEALLQFGRAEHVAALDVLDELRVPEMFLDRDDLRPALLRHDVVLPGWMFCQPFVVERPMLSYMKPLPSISSTG